MLIDVKDPDNFSLKIALIGLEFNNRLIKEDKTATLFSAAGQKYGFDDPRQTEVTEKPGRRCHIWSDD